MKKKFTPQNLKLIAVVGVLLAIVTGFAAYTRAPVYGNYTATNLISFTDYRHADMTKVIPNELELMRMIRQVGLPKTLAQLQADPGYQAQGLCHEAAHAVGRAAFDLLGADAFAQCTTACFSGCYHGAFQRMSSRTDSEGSMLQAVRDLCSVRDTIFQKTQCFHGSGHGLLLYTNYDLQKALDACRQLGSGPEPGWCFGGVFMEYLAAGPPASEFDNGNIPKDLHAPCDEVGNDPTAIKWCYQLQPDIFLEAYHDDYAKASAECMKAPEVGRPDCFKRLGQLYGIDTPDPSASAERFCGTVPSQYFTDCIIGGVRQYIDFYGEDVGTKAVDFCKGLSAAAAKQVCYSEVAERLKDLFNDIRMRTKLCGDFEAPYNASCVAAQALPPASANDFLPQ